MIFTPYLTSLPTHMLRPPKKNCVIWYRPIPKWYEGVTLDPLWCFCITVNQFQSGFASRKEQHGTLTLILYRAQCSYFSTLLPNTKIVKDAILLEVNTEGPCFIFLVKTTIDTKQNTTVSSICESWRSTWKLMTKIVNKQQ